MSQREDITLDTTNTTIDTCIAKASVSTEERYDRPKRAHQSFQNHRVVRVHTRVPIRLVKRDAEQSVMCKAQSATALSSTTARPLT